MNKLSHAYILSAPTREESLREAHRLAMTAVCEDSRQRPCGLCRHCRKAKAGIHPDIRLVERLVDDKGKQKRELVVSQIRELAVDACILPNEAEGKAYILCDADTMNASAQNAALKLLEEPPRGVVFLLCVTNPALLLPTVRSRCVELVCGSTTQEEEGESRELARAFLAQVAAGREEELFRWCSAQEGMDTRSLTDFLSAAREETADILCARRENPGLSRRQLFRLEELLGLCLSYTKVNVGVKHIFGLLAVRGIAGAETEDK